MTILKCPSICSFAAAAFSSSFRAFVTTSWTNEFCKSPVCKLKTNTKSKTKTQRVRMSKKAEDQPTKKKRKAHMSLISAANFDFSLGKANKSTQKARGRGNKPSGRPAAAPTTESSPQRERGSQRSNKKALAM
jgi:hypothetical protein